MNTLLLWSHPVMQFIAVLTGLFALRQGFKRFAMLRGKKVIFPWKKHVKLGSITLLLWILGLTGFGITFAVFEAINITGAHACLAIAIVVLSIFGLVTGFVMNKYKKRRKVLPMIHGISNIVLVILILIQCYLGIGLMREFLF